MSDTSANNTFLSDTFVSDTFNRLVSEAMKEPFEGWDFSYIEDSGRVVESPLKWNYINNVRRYFHKTGTLLDMGTGGGEVLSRLAPFPPKTYATETYPPNVEVARRNLCPLGVEVLYVEDASEPPYNDDLPFDSKYFDLVINRHEAYSPRELKRILKPNGIFITQQVGCFTMANLLKDMLGKNASYGNWNLQSAANELESSAFTILEAGEHIYPSRFYDIGAIVYYLKAIPWLVEGFSPNKYRRELIYIHSRIERDGYYETLNHRFIVVAKNN